MRKKDSRRQGIAAVEFALMLPVLAALILLLVEGSNAMHTYSSLVEASREGARHVLMEGDTANVDALVAALVGDLDQQELSTDVTTDAEAHTVTVAVYYNYSMFGSSNEDQEESQEESDDTFKLVAQTTMPLP